MGQRSVGANPSAAESYQEVAIIDPITGAHSRTGHTTYGVSATGYAAYATPTDMVGIRGSASNIIRVTGLRFQVHSTAAAGIALHFIKRSTANTGGTLTNPAGVPYDSTSPAPTAVVDLYTAAPTTGAAAGTVQVTESVSAVATVAPVNAALYGGTALYAGPGLVSFQQPILLRGIAEALYINFAGAAIPAGFSAAWGVEWTESNA
jgi:hypothetical protein